ncbi:hypothetical protein [Nocardia carnea]|uniref:hypothetical protein n=1 Tax=Nocardia carnea TaxID=37328 RepID=UPI002458C8EC|nr:hypothetical protein [Nocardia carnea]
MTGNLQLGCRRRGMRSSDRMMSPTAWRTSGRYVGTILLSTVFLAGFAAMCFMLAMAGCGSTDKFGHAASKYVALLGISMLVLAVTGIAGLITRTRSTSRIRLDSVDGTSVTAIPGAIPTFALYQLMCFCFAVLLLGASLEIAVSGQPILWIAALALFCMGLFFASTPGLALAGRIRRASLVLTPQEIVYEGWSSRMSLPWSDVTGVLAASMDNTPLICVIGWEGAVRNHPRTPSIRFVSNSYRFWKLEVQAPDGAVVLECPRLAADAHRLFRFLTYYAHTPEARMELGTPAALNRWATV